MCCIQERNAISKSKQVFTTKNEENSQLNSDVMLYLIASNIYSLFDSVVFFNFFVVL